MMMITVHNSFISVSTTYNNFTDYKRIVAGAYPARHARPTAVGLRAFVSAEFQADVERKLIPAHCLTATRDQVLRARGKHGRTHA